MKDTRCLSLLLFWLVVKAALAIILLVYGNIGLSPDEAQYWTWSQNIDWGYYSKPPGIAWQIWAGCQFLGNTELGVRVGAVVMATLLALAVYLLARCAGLKPRVAMWAGVVMSFSPIGIMASFAAVTDGGFILFWTLAVAAYAYDMKRQRAPRYFLVGFLIALGALFKWPQIYYLWGPILVFAWIYPFLRSKKTALAIALSCLGLLFSLIWNITHGWANLLHIITLLTGAKSAGEPRPFFDGNFWEFWGSQLGVLSPVFFVILLTGLYAMVKRHKKLSPALLFCGWLCLSLLILAGGRALLRKVQPNWFICAYPSGIIILVWYAGDLMKRGFAWLKAGTVISVALSALVIAVPYLQAHNIGDIPFKLNAFQHNLGWRALGDALKDYDLKNHFLFSDKYQTTSILSFYNPQQKLAYFFNIKGNRKNQFSFWPGMEDEQVGKDGYFVMVEKAPNIVEGEEQYIASFIRDLSPYFEEVQFVESVDLFVANGRLAKGALIFECLNYNGKTPATVEAY
ncbi:MAG: ArnT family glycosyltransferase [Chlamydiota bacterium]